MEKREKAREFTVLCPEENQKNGEQLYWKRRARMNREGIPILWCKLWVLCFHTLNLVCSLLPAIWLDAWERDDSYTAYAFLAFQCILDEEIERPLEMWWNSDWVGESIVVWLPDWTPAKSARNSKAYLLDSHIKWEKESLRAQSSLSYNRSWWSGHKDLRWEITTIDDVTSLTSSCSVDWAIRKGLRLPRPNSRQIGRPLDASRHENECPSCNFEISNFKIFRKKVRKQGKTISVK